MLTKYIQAAMCKATYEFLPEDSVIYGRIPGFDGVWATAETLEACREELLEVLEDWILIGLRMNHELPVIDNIKLRIPNPHRGDISRALLARLLREAGISREEWEKV